MAPSYPPSWCRWSHCQSGPSWTLGGRRYCHRWFRCNRRQGPTRVQGRENAGAPYPLPFRMGQPVAGASEAPIQGGRRPPLLSKRSKIECHCEMPVSRAQTGFRSKAHRAYGTSPLLRSFACYTPSTLASAARLTVGRAILVAPSESHVFRADLDTCLCLRRAYAGEGSRCGARGPSRVPL